MSGELHLHLSQVRVWSQDGSVTVLSNSQMCVLSVSASVYLNVSLSLTHTVSGAFNTVGMDLGTNQHKKIIISLI